jgi:hypothetical protein
MRHFRRFNHLKKLWFAIFVATVAACVGVAGASVDARGASADATQASGAVALPPAWNDAVSALADKIAGAVSPSHPVALVVKNASPLEAGDVDAVRGVLEAQLAQHHFRVTRSAAAETRIDVTLSESGASYVWVAELRTKDENADPEVAVVSVAKASAAASANGGATLTIQKTLVWQQPAKFLDFRESTVAGDETLEVLEPGRVAFYTQSAGTWTLDHEAAISHRVVWPRDVRGNFMEATTGMFATISGVTCTGGGTAKGAPVLCAGTPLSGDGAKASLIPGRETGEAILLKGPCGDAQMALASGNGDWSQADTLRGYLLRKKSATASGAALDFDGPVLSLTVGVDGEARAIVLNLKTGNYEGYSVSATCGE